MVASDAELTGATAATPGICSATASESSWVKFGTPAEEARGPKPMPGRNISRLLPRAEMRFFTACVVASPSVTMVITAPTPMMIPSTVRKARVRLRRISRNAIKKAFQIMISMASVVAEVGFDEAVFHAHDAAGVRRDVIL